MNLLVGPPHDGCLGYQQVVRVGSTVLYILILRVQKKCKKRRSFYWTAEPFALAIERVCVRQKGQYEDRGSYVSSTGGLTAAKPLRIRCRCDGACKHRGGLAAQAKLQLVVAGPGTAPAPALTVPLGWGTATGATTTGTMPWRLVIPSLRAVAVVTSTTLPST
jgi:hypothetical protein